jgi:hypothetical protein
MRKNNRCKSPSPACGRGRDPRQREGEGSSRRKVEGDFVSSLARPYPHPARLTLATFSRKREKGWTRRSDPVAATIFTHRLSPTHERPVLICPLRRDRQRQPCPAHLPCGADLLCAQQSAHSAMCSTGGEQGSPPMAGSHPQRPFTTPRHPAATLPVPAEAIE